MHNWHTGGEWGRNSSGKFRLLEFTAAKTPFSIMSDTA